MTITIVSLLLALLWLCVCAYAHGWPNTVDHVAYLLHRHARAVRKMHVERTAVVTERWVRSLEETAE